MTDHTPHTQDQPPRFGRGMLIIFWLLVLGGLVFIIGRWQEKREYPNQNIQGTENASSRSVQLKRNVHGHYLTTGQINQHPVQFMLDTGATNVAIPLGVAKELGLKQGYAHKVVTANGITTAYQTELKHLKIGTIVLNDVKASITVGMGGEQILLGMSALKQLDFNQSGKTLTLTQYR